MTIYTKQVAVHDMRRTKPANVQVHMKTSLNLKKAGQREMEQTPNFTLLQQRSLCQRRESQLRGKMKKTAAVTSEPKRPILQQR